MPTKAGQVKREDYYYKRNGTAVVLAAVEPLINPSQSAFLKQHAITHVLLLVEFRSWIKGITFAFFILLLSEQIRPIDQR